jgi:hypothetical protein
MGQGRRQCSKLDAHVGSEADVLHTENTKNRERKTRNQDRNGETTTSINIIDSEGGFVCILDEEAKPSRRGAHPVYLFWV